MKYKIFLISFIIFSLKISAQKTEKVELQNSEDYYLKIIPKASPTAILFLLHGGGETPEDVLKQIELHQLAVKNNFLVILPYFSEGTTKMIEETNSINQIAVQLMNEYQISKDKIILGGFSGGGMLSITFAERSVRDKNTDFIPKAVFAIDTPLDFEQIYQRSEREIKRNFSEIGVGEANFMIDEFNKTFGGSPSEFPEEYEKYSMFTYRKEDGGNAKYLLEIPIRIYTEPGVEWQLENRQRDLYDLNCTNISAMINLLQINGNKNAEVITTFNKGKRLNGAKHPHSWSIMDSKDTMKWMLKQLE